MRITSELIRRCSSKHLVPMHQQHHSEEEHLERITHLYLQEQHIRKIENLDPCHNLIALYLYDNNIEKIENLEDLISLTCLYLHKNSITRIENLETLSQLTVLNLGHNSISKVEGLESLCELRELYIQYQTLPDDQSLEFDPATVEWLGGILRVLNVSGNRLQSFSALKPLEQLETFTAEENDVWDLQDLVNVFSNWKCARVIKLTGNPVCNTKKYRDNVVVMCLELEELDGKVVPQAYRNFLLNWKQCLRLQDRKKESYAVLKPFLETQSYVSEQFAKFQSTAQSWLAVFKDKLTATWESVIHNFEIAIENAKEFNRIELQENSNVSKIPVFAQCSCCKSQYFILPQDTIIRPIGDTAPLQTPDGYRQTPSNVLSNLKIQSETLQHPVASRNSVSFSHTAHMRSSPSEEAIQNPKIERSRITVRQISQVSDSTLNNNMIEHSEGTTHKPNAKRIRLEKITDRLLGNFGTSPSAETTQNLAAERSFASGSQIAQETGSTLNNILIEQSEETSQHSKAKRSRLENLSERSPSIASGIQTVQEPGSTLEDILKENSAETIQEPKAKRSCVAVKRKERLTNLSSNITPYMPRRIKRQS